MKTAVVTGATAGIGLEIARGLAHAGHRVVVVGRGRDRVAAAVDIVRGAAADPLAVVPIIGDLATVGGIRDVGDAVARLDRLDALVHCAGLWPTRKVITVDGFEEAFAVNHLAPAILNERLRPLLAASAPARVIQVSAGLYIKGRVDLERDPGGDSFHRFRTYATTKLWNLLETLELARSLDASSIAVTAVHPGVVRTKLGDPGGLLGLVLRFIKRSWLTPEQGARGPVHLADAPDPAARHGMFFDQTEPMALASPADDRALASAVAAKTRAILDAR
ncbi:MAG: SDR family NAD(P)-dependent oxidoreductase [Kofleriaceae bacterium]|nr:SDR family NAD(P)-dependent oxidoreductase [Kofleriaceae bacterium]